MKIDRPVAENFGEKDTVAFSSAEELRDIIDMDMNLRDKALDSFTRVMDIRTTLLDPDDGFIATSLTALSIVHTELGNLDEDFASHQKSMNVILRTSNDRIGNSYWSMSSLPLRMVKTEEMLRCPSLNISTDNTFFSLGIRAFWVKLCFS